MKTSIKTLAYAAMVSIAFFACDDIGTNVNSGNECKTKVAAKCTEDMPPYVPNEEFLRIEPPVKRWMEEQFASGKNDTLLVVVIDLIAPKYEYESGIAYMVPERDGNECGGVCYWLGGRKVDVEEYNKWIEGYYKEREEKRRVSPIIGKIVTEGDHGWDALMTAEEIIELTEKYKGLIIDRRMEIVDGENSR